MTNAIIDESTLENTPFYDLEGREHHGRYNPSGHHYRFTDNRTNRTFILVDVFESRDIADALKNELKKTYFARVIYDSDKYGVEVYRSEFKRREYKD